MAATQARPLCPCGNGRLTGHQGNCRGSLRGAERSIGRRRRAIRAAKRELATLRNRRRQLHERMLAIAARLEALDRRISQTDARFGEISRRSPWSPAVQPPILSPVESVALRALRSTTAIEPSAVLPDIFEAAVDAGYSGTTWTLRSALDALARRGIVARGPEEGTYRRAVRGRR